MNNNSQYELINSAMVMINKQQTIKNEYPALYKRGEHISLYQIPMCDYLYIGHDIGIEQQILIHSIYEDTIDCIQLLFSY